MRVDIFLLGALAVWRFAHLLTAEDGPAHLVARLRRRVTSRFWSSLLDCFQCLSLWMSVPFAVLVGNTWRECFLVWPALSAIAIFVEHVMNSLDRPDPVAWEYPHGKEGHDELLRENESERRRSYAGSAGGVADEAATPR